MSLPSFLDLVDIKDHLNNDNILIKAKGFSYLANKLLKRQLEYDPAKTENHRQVLFDCFCDYGDVCVELLIELLPELMKVDVVPKEKILNEFMLRLPRVHKINRTFPAVLNVTLPPFSKFLELATRVDPELMTKMFLGQELQKEHYRYMTVLVFSGLLNDDQKRRLGNMPLVQPFFLYYFPQLYPIDLQYKYDTANYLSDCPQGELQCNYLLRLDYFEKLKLMNERPILLRNPNIGQHIIYMPFMYLMIQYVPSVAQVLDTYKPQQSQVRTQFDECLKKIEFRKPDFDREALTLELFLSHIIEKKTASSFSRFVEHCIDQMTMFKKPYYLAGLTALLPHVQDDPFVQKKIIDLVVEFCKRSEEHANAFVLFFMGVAFKPCFNISQELIMSILPGLIFDSATLTPVAGFFTVTSQHEGPGREKALYYLAKLVKTHASVISKARVCIQLSVDDTEAIFRAQMTLAKECCIALSENDDILNIINEFMNHDGFRLAATVDAIYDLVKEDVLELMGVRDQLIRRVKFLGNEAACASFCRILSLGINREDDEEDDEYEMKKKSLIEDLYEFTEHSNDEIASEAWKALGVYSISDIEETVELKPSLYGEKFTKIKTGQRGFVEFINQHLKIEKETYQRPLYNVGVQTPDVPSLMSKVDTYKDHLGVKHKDEAWFWQATLPLTASILQLSAPSNKAQTAVRLLKASLLNVPLAESHEEMLRLMAGWRICVREALNVLLESKSNDLLWARDQICQEGRLCLTQKSESVDCIMMMLTVLVDAVEEKLRLIDDQKQVDEVTIAQKPWMLSVFEFVATRLPKNVKDKREPRVNPIYQVMTHSNKSSLFTAIFCTRLLYQNAVIAEFYRDAEELGLQSDRMFTYLLEDSSKTLESSDIPHRNLLWITAEAYGVNEWTAKAFEEEYQMIIDDKTEKFEEPPLENNDDIEKFFKSLLVAPKSLLIEAQQKNRKVLEKLWNNGNEEVRIKIYKGLSELSLMSGTGRKRTMIPVEKLSDSSVLRGILQQFDEKLKIDSAVLRSFIPTFANHQREDGRYLPPVDWMKLLERAEWKKAVKETRLALVSLACQQNISDVLSHFAGELTPDELYVIADNFRTVMKIVPRKEFVRILFQMTSQARKFDETRENVQKLAKAIAEYEKDPVIHLFLTVNLPKLKQTIGVTDPILCALKEPNAFVGLISKTYDVWVEAHNGVKMNMKRICDLINEELDHTEMLVLLSYEARRLSPKKRIDKILDMITSSRISREAGADLSAYFSIFLALIVSFTEEVDIPICFFGTETSAIHLMCAARKPFFNVLLKCPEMKNDAKHIGSFLRYYLDGSESDFYQTWEKTIAADMLVSLVANFATDALPSLFHEEDLFWQTMMSPMLD